MSGFKAVIFDAYGTLLRNDDLVLVPARQGDSEDNSEYEEILPTSPP